MNEKDHLSIDTEKIWGKCQGKYKEALMVISQSSITVPLRLSHFLGLGIQ